MNKFTIRQLEYLVAVGQYSNLTEAARHLRVSQPAINRNWENRTRRTDYA